MEESELNRIVKIANMKPRGIAIFGPSMKRGFYWIKSLINLNYDGAILPIHPKLHAAVGIHCYKTLNDVPESIPVDYAIIAVPKHLVPEVLDQCIARRINMVQIFTSGYSEHDPVEGKRAEQELLDLLEKRHKETGHRLRIIGPNCIGIYSPKFGMGFRSDLSTEYGKIGVISQSGGLAINIALRGKMLGVRFSKVVSIGNAIDMKPADFIKILNNDPATKCIGCYFEALSKDVEGGRRLLENIRETVKEKPVIIWRGGKTERGSIAASSHTGALKTSDKMWNAFVRQSGVIPVDSFEEFMDTLLAYQTIKLAGGKNIALISISGGSAVTATDDIIEEGLNIPALTEETQAQIMKRVAQKVGVSAKNPIDLGASYYGFSLIAHTILDVCKDENVDILFMEISAHYVYNATIMAFKDFPKLYFDEVLKALKKAKRDFKKPVFVIMPDIAYESETITDRHFFMDNNIPVFPTVRRAAKVVRNLERYKEYINKEA
ncbi:MAG: CoA-binding protein [Candidatus Hodarchaeota archaeon]